MKVHSNGHTVRVGHLEWPAHYEHFDPIVTTVEDHIGRYLDFGERLSIQTLLGAFWPKRTLRFS